MGGIGMIFVNDKPVSHIDGIACEPQHRERLGDELTMLEGYTPREYNKYGEITQFNTHLNYLGDKQ